MIVLMVISVGLIGLSFSEGNINAMNDGSFTEVVINYTIVVFLVAAFGAVIAELIALILLSDTKTIIKKVVALACAAVLILVCWSMADTTPLQILGYEGTQNTPMWLSIADTSIFLFYIFFVVAVVSIIASEVYNALK